MSIRIRKNDTGVEGYWWNVEEKTSITWNVLITCKTEAFATIIKNDMNRSNKMWTWSTSDIGVPHYWYRIYRVGYYSSDPFARVHNTDLPRVKSLLKFS